MFCTTAVTGAAPVQSWPDFMFLTGKILAVVTLFQVLPLSIL